MSITIIFIELIIIGVQSLTWIALFVFTQLELSTILLLLDSLSIEIMLILVICFGYCLGIFFDRVADAVFSKWNQKIKNEVIPNPLETYGMSIGTMRYIVVENNSHLNTYLEYTRSRIRIARASSINIPIITIVFLFFGVSKNIINLSSSLSFIIIILGGGITLTSIKSWENLTKRHLDLIKTSFINKGKNYASIRNEDAN